MTVLSATLLLILLSWMIAPSVQNYRTRTRRGSGPRHREPGMATPWRRRRTPVVPSLVRRPSPALLEMREWTRARSQPAVISTTEWLKMVNLGRRVPPAIRPVAQLRAVDLRGLQRVAGGRL